MNFEPLTLKFNKDNYNNKGLDVKKAVKAPFFAFSQIE